jgi:hypothetical protein
MVSHFNNHKRRNMITENKSNLAKLLSEENLIVEQRKVSTAFFNAENRLLVLPTLKENLSPDVTDMMISHEVGHALFTEADPWKVAVSEQEINHTILNVVEDSRIEKKIKYKYPGLRSIYSRAYKELNELDFFGLDGKDVSKLNLIDKINLHFKIGFIKGIDFDQRELEYVDMVENVQSFDDVVKVSKMIQDYMKEKFNKKPGLNDDDFDDDFELEFTWKKSRQIPGEGSKNNENQNENQNEFRNGLPDYQIENEDEESSIEASTDIASKEYTETVLLRSDSFKQSYYVDVPDYDIKDYIVDYAKLYRELVSQINTEIQPNIFNLFKKETNSIVSFLVKEFMLKKNADSRKKAKVSKTGDINVSKLFGYKIYDDIFKKSTTVQNSKSHGLVFFLDWSFSMFDYMEDTIKQLITMLLFCKKLNIPFEVYAFTSKHYNTIDLYKNPSEPVNQKKAILFPVTLMNLFSSRMNINEFNLACRTLLTVFEKYERAGIPGWFELGNTPLNHSIILSKKVMESFKERTKVQISNAIYLTDGESHQIKFAFKDDYHSISHNLLTNEKSKVYLRDIKTKITKPFYIKNKRGLSWRETSEYETNSCLDFVREQSDFKMFGFRLITNTELIRNLKQRIKYDSSIVKSFKKTNCALDVDNSYDEFYYIKSNVINVDEEFEEIGEKESVSSITKKFTKSMNSKVNNRIFLKKFIEFIS